MELSLIVNEAKDLLDKIINEIAIDFKELLKFAFEFVIFDQKKQYIH